MTLFRDVSHDAFANHDNFYLILFQHNVRDSRDTQLNTLLWRVSFYDFFNLREWWEIFLSMRWHWERLYREALMNSLLVDDSPSLDCPIMNGSLPSPLSPEPTELRDTIVNRCIKYHARG